MSNTILPEFRSHKLNEDGQCAVKAVAEAVSACLATIEQYLPPNRERSLVVTKLQEASFFANRGISLDPRYQETPEQK